MTRTFDEFRAAFPRLYSDVRCGFHCPPGWVSLVWLLSEELAPHGVVCDQVKEKFGSLRFYLLYGHPAAEKLIAIAEGLSLLTCQDCGKRGTLGKRGKWHFATLCPEHTPKDVPQDVPGFLR